MEIKQKIKRIAEWLDDHLPLSPRKMVFCGLIVVVVGLIIEDSYVLGFGCGTALTAFLYR